MYINVLCWQGGYHWIRYRTWSNHIVSILVIVVCLLCKMCLGHRNRPNPSKKYKLNSPYRSAPSKVASFYGFMHSILIKEDQANTTPPACQIQCWFIVSSPGPTSCEKKGVVNTEKYLGSIGGVASYLLHCVLWLVETSTWAIQTYHVPH